jgi:hypothetical protein
MPHDAPLTLTIDMRYAHGVKVTKRCSKCSKRKRVASFGRDASRSDGLSCWCRACTAASAKRYRSTAAGRAKMRDLVRRWRAGNPEKVKAAKLRQAERMKKLAEEDPKFWKKKYAANREAAKARALAWTRKQPPGYRRDQHLRHRYGMTLAEWERLFREQGSACAVCRTTNSGGRQWTTDHCHTTGAFRGILCDSCNVVLGRIRESPETALALLRYIRRKCVPILS